VRSRIRQQRFIGAARMRRLSAPVHSRRELRCGKY
jgi:hypothetical protein